MIPDDIGGIRITPDLEPCVVRYHTQKSTYCHVIVPADKKRCHRLAAEAQAIQTRESVHLPPKDCIKDSM